MGINRRCRPLNIDFDSQFTGPVDEVVSIDFDNEIVTYFDPKDKLDVYDIDLISWKLLNKYEITREEWAS